MRQLLIVAIMAIVAIARSAYAQTPEPVRDGPHGEPVHDGPHGEPVHDGPHGEPVHDGPYGQPVPPDDAGVPPADAPKPEPPKQEPPKTQAPQPPQTQSPQTQSPQTQSPKTTTPTTTTTPKTSPTTSPQTTPKTTTPTPQTTPKTSQPAVPPKTSPPIDPTVQRLEPMRANPAQSMSDAIASGEVPAEGEIKKIVVEGNEKTTSDTVELIARIEVGDHWSADMVDVVKERLVSSGLFKDVEVFWTKAEGGVEVHILAQDKHSWVIAPAFYNQPTNTGGGIGFGENNLFGKNQKLLLYGQIATGDSFFIGAWLIPNLGGTRFYGQLDTYLKSARNFEYTAPTKYLIGPDDIRAVRESRMHYFNFGGNLGIELFRGVKIGTRLRAAWVSYVSSKLAKGAMIDDLYGPGADPSRVIDKPGGEGWDISNEWSFTIDRRANWYGVQTGRKMSVALERSVLGSDFHYWLLSFSGFRAYQVLERHNLVFKGTFGYGHNLPFQQELLTGGTSMRGWLNNEFRGNLRTLVNVEYSVPVFTIHGFGVRGLAFWDSAYTTFTRENDDSAQDVGVQKREYLPNAEVRGLHGFKNSVGVGTRFYLRQIVLPLLGLDFGYGLEARDLQIYLAIGLTD